MKHLLITAALMGVIFTVSAQRFDNENDNYRFFYDIGIERGLMIPIDGISLTEGTTFSITGSWFYQPSFGFRSGLTLINGFGANSSYSHWRVPILFAFRTRTFTNDFGDWRSHPDYWSLSFCERLWRGTTNFFLSLLPTRFEINAGTSLGAFSPTDTGVSDISRRFASTLDANARLSFQFWRICVNGNFGISYLLTRNVYSVNWHNEATRPAWFGNVGFGATFRF